VEKGGYLVTLDFQQDSTWNQNYLPHPIALLDPDLEDNVGVVLADHEIFKIPNEITEEHFGAGIGAREISRPTVPNKSHRPGNHLLPTNRTTGLLLSAPRPGKGMLSLIRSDSSVTGEFG